MSVVTEVNGHVLSITMRRPTKRNAIDAEMTQGLDSALNELDDNPALRVGVLCGTESAFSAGTDLAAGRGSPTPRGGNYGVVQRDRRKPLIAAVEGHAYGGGFEIVLACDIVVASRTATFALPEAKLGVIADCGALFRAPRALPLNIAKQMLLTGAPLSADRAYSVGLVNELTPVGGAKASALSMAELVASNAPISVSESLRVINAQFAQAEQHGWHTTASAAAYVMSTEDQQEGVEAFFAKRLPHWENR